MSSAGGLNWRKSSHSASNGNCVEVTTLPPLVAVRDTQDARTGPVLTFTADAWGTFTDALRTTPGGEVTGMPTYTDDGDCIEDEER